MQNPALISICKMHVVTPSKKRDIHWRLAQDWILPLLCSSTRTSQCNDINMIHLFQAYWCFIVKIVQSKVWIIHNCLKNKIIWLCFILSDLLKTKQNPTVFNFSIMGETMTFLKQQLSSCNLIEPFQDRKQSLNYASLFRHRNETKSLARQIWWGISLNHIINMCGTIGKCILSYCR